MYDLEEIYETKEAETKEALKWLDAKWDFEKVIVIEREVEKWEEK